MTDLALPVADPWILVEDMGQGVTRLSEPSLARLIRANFYHVRGREGDLLIDSGTGVVPLRSSLPQLFGGRRVVAVATHTHVDHMGAIHEFDERLVHRLEAGDLAAPHPWTLMTRDLDAGLMAALAKAGIAPGGRYLLDALPFAGYRPETYRLQGAAPTRILEDGDVIDLGDRAFEVLHLPGHSPGSIALWEAATRTLFAGDVIYDGVLLYRGAGTSVTDYVRSFERLGALPVETVHAGHRGSFGAERLGEIIAAYLARWREEGLIGACD